jgi:hypothetical protein
METSGRFRIEPEYKDPSIDNVKDPTELFSLYSSAVNMHRIRAASYNRASIQAEEKNDMEVAKMNYGKVRKELKGIAELISRLPKSLDEIRSKTNIEVSDVTKFIVDENAEVARNLINASCYEFGITRDLLQPYGIDEDVEKSTYYSWLDEIVDAKLG